MSDFGPLEQVVMKIECCSDNNVKFIEAIMKAVTDVCLQHHVHSVLF